MAAVAAEHTAIRARVSGRVSTVRGLLPRGGSLPLDVWQRRHRALLAVLVAHVVAVAGYGLVLGFSVAHALAAAAPVASFWFAARRATRRTVQACLCSAGLITASSLLVHLSGGVIEVHFHFFVMVALLTLYQDWLPYLTALTLIVLEHGVVGVAVPHSVYNHDGAWQHPWLWALVHGFFVLFASAASLAAWSINEHDHLRVQEELEDLRMMREEQLRYQSHHDALTGLGNRRMLTETLDGQLLSDQRTPVALLFVDLDGFKLVNDLFGHDIGDFVLIEVSRRIGCAVRSRDVATRLGGDEFVVLCVDLVDESAALLLAQRIEEEVGRPIATPVGEIRVTASVGIACSDAWPHDAARLLHDADLAMYRAKQLGKDRCQLFDADLRQAIEERAGREAFLERALDEDRLVLHYQPIVSTAGEIVAVEALLRLVADDGSLVAPAPYIAVAEETGQVSRITEWVLAQACHQIAEWRRDVSPDLVVSVNVSGRELGRQQLRDSVLGALTSAGIGASALMLELTETALFDTTPDQVAQLSELLGLGVRIGLDDFGTGYTSLQYLRSLPLSFVKVDRSFVVAVPDSPADRAIVRAVAELCTQLGLQCVAEGVETAEHADALREIGVAYLQGYLLCRPLPALAITDVLRGTPDPAIPAPRSVSGEMVAP